MSYDRRDDESKTKTAATTVKAHPLSKTATWWQDAPLPQMGTHFNYSQPEKWFGIPMLLKALEGGEPVRINEWEGNLVVHGKHLIESLEKILQIRPVQINNTSMILGSDASMLYIKFSGNGKTGYASLATTDLEAFQKANMLLSRCLIPDDPKKGVVFTLSKGPMGFDISRLGVAGSPIERGNYSEGVLEAYDHVVNDLNADSPCGRLTVLAGEPGTGKTYLVRGLLQDAHRCAFIIIPPHMVEDLTAPEILPALTSAKRQINGPIALILEDGDRVLVPRENGDMSAISSLLNLGDGILGSVLDIRLVVTTNAEKVEMDPATRRPGRLCRYIPVDALSPERAMQALHRLTGKLHKFEEPTTIAAVYRQARNMGWEPPKDEAGPESPEMTKRVEML